MNTLTVKLPEQLDEQLAALARREHLSKSEVVRQALAAYIRQSTAKSDAGSSLDSVMDLVGCFEGGPADLSSNPDHLAGFGLR
ncbi:MAG: CopG family transcriptional regulator [Betaproteobacteria bacterium]|nr:CopG family transcriptional regulator [Betaproteobacteria bacterium]